MVVVIVWPCWWWYCPLPQVIIRLVTQIKCDHLKNVPSRVPCGVLSPVVIIIAVLVVVPVP